MAGENKKKKISPKKTNNKSSNNKISKIRPWFVLLIALAIIGTYFYVVNDGGKKPNNQNSNVENYTVEKTGAGANVDFTEKTKQIHNLVDEVLAQNEIEILDIKKQQKNVKRQGIEGKIIWSNREIPISVTDDQIKKFKKDIETVLNKVNAQIIDIVPDHYQGEKVTRIDIGIKDTLEGDTITIIADKVYILPSTIKHVTKAPPQTENSDKVKMALVIDDFGYTKEPITAYREIDCPLTFAILPNHPYSLEAAKQGYEDGRQIILHLPMEAISDQAKEEPQTIHVSMNDSEIRAMVSELTNAVPHIIGVNNHQGSRVTSNRKVMNVILNQLTEQGLFFIDSKTSASSEAYSMAKEIGVLTAENQIFIDNSSDINAIKSQLKKAANIAQRNGKVIAIGHARPNTVKALKAMVPELEAQGIQFVFASTLLE